MVWSWLSKGNCNINFEFSKIILHYLNLNLLKIVGGPLFQKQPLRQFFKISVIFLQK